VDWGQTPEPVRIDSPVHTFDVSRTILEMAGVEPVVPVQAKSLLPILRGEADSVWEHAYVEKHSTAALRDGEYKYIVTRKERKGGARLEEELYDLSADPGETKDIAKERPDKVREFRRKALAIQKLNEEFRQGRSAEDVALDPKTIEELRSLGYLK